MSSPYDTPETSGPGPSFEPAGGYPSHGRPSPQPSAPIADPYVPARDPYAPTHNPFAPTHDPYASQPRTNLYGQPVDPYAQHGMSPYGSYGGGSYGVQAYSRGPAKSKAAAGLLAFFLGNFGAHWFYLGKKALGIGHLALVVLGLVLMTIGGANADSGGAAGLAVFGFLLWAVNGLWSFVDLIIIMATSESDLGR